MKIGQSNLLRARVTRPGWCRDQRYPHALCLLLVFGLLPRVQGCVQSQILSSDLNKIWTIRRSSGPDILARASCLGEAGRGSKGSYDKGGGLAVRIATYRRAGRLLRLMLASRENILETRNCVRQDGIQETQASPGPVQVWAVDIRAHGEGHAAGLQNSVAR